METNPPVQSPSSDPSLAARVGWAVLIVSTLCVCYFSHLGAIGLVGPDEPRYAWIAREMAETGDWVTPRLYGKPWFEKPPLYYWGAALSFKLFGVSEAAARLPSAVSALLGTLALAWLAWRLYGVETACWLLLLLPTTVGMIGFSHAAATDMPFSAMLSIAMVAAAVVVRLAPEANASMVGDAAAGRASPPATKAWLTLVAFGFFLGLAVLAKGPAAIILCGGAMFLWALCTKCWRDVFRLLHPIAVAAFCCTALPWYILCGRRNPDFFRVFIIEHNFKRYLTPEFQHVQPFWYYIPILLLALLPWTNLLSWSASFGAQRLLREKQLSAAVTFFVSWTLFVVIFFSISRSKLPGYILPAIPAIAILLARSYVALVPGNRKSFCWALLSTAFALFSISLFLLFARRMPQANQRFAAAAILIVAAIGAANLFLGWFSLTHEQTAFLRLAAASSVLPILITLSLTDKLLPSFFRWDPSGRSIARELEFRRIPTSQLAVAGMSRGLHYSLNFYVATELKDWDRNNPSEGYLLMPERHCTSVVPPTFFCEEIPFDQEATGSFLYRVTPANLPDRPRGGGQLQ